MSFHMFEDRFLQLGWRVWFWFWVGGSVFLFTRVSVISAESEWEIIRRFLLNQFSSDCWFVSIASAPSFSASSAKRKHHPRLWRHYQNISTRRLGHACGCVLISSRRKCETVCRDEFVRSDVICNWLLISWSGLCTSTELDCVNN